MTMTELDDWIEQNFAGHGVAVRTQDETPIPGEPFMSMAVAKNLIRAVVVKFAAEALS